MTRTESRAKRVKIQVIDVFHGVQEIGSTERGNKGDSPARMGFFLGDDDEHLFLEIEDCPVTAVAREEPREAVSGLDEDHENTTGTSERAQILPPTEFHLGEVLDVCHAQEASKPPGVHTDFDYLASQMTQAPSQDPAVCIQTLIKQSVTPGGGTTSGQGENVASVPKNGRDQSSPHALAPYPIPMPSPAAAHPSRPREVFSPPSDASPPPPSSGGSIFKTGRGVKIPVDPQRVFAATRLLDAPLTNSHPVGGSLFSTGSGKALAVDPDKVAAQRQLLEGGDSCIPKAFPAPRASCESIFSTGTGISIKIDPKKLASSRRLLGEEGNDRTASGANASPLLPRSNHGYGAGGSIFHTGSGSSITISKDRVDAARKLLEGTHRLGSSELRKSSTPMMSRFAPNRIEAVVNSVPKSINAGSKTLANTPGHDLLQRPRSSGAAGVQTPHLATPQNKFGGTKGGLNLTPGSSVAGSINRSVVTRPPLSSEHVPRQPGQPERREFPGPSQFNRNALPITPCLASKFAFGGMYGPGDVRAHLLSKGAIPDVASDAWVRNHYKWVVWKLANVELYAEWQVENSLGKHARGTYRPGSHLKYDAVKDELLARYNREYVEGKRSYLKGVLQRDFPVGVPCILKVASVATNASRTACTLQLTDGWYGIYAECDKQLLSLALKKKLFIGQKLRICGAELTGGGPGDPLDVVNETRMILSYNLVHPVHHETKLGAQPGCQPITPLSYIDEKGGRTPRTVVSVLRMFPPMVWTKLPSGVTTFQTPDKAGKAEAALEMELDRIYSQVKNEIDQEDLATCKAWIKEGKAGGIKHVERLYAEMVVRGDAQFAENLNTQDKADLETFISERRAQLEQDRQDKVRDVLGTEVPAAVGAKTTPCQTILVGEVSCSSADSTGRGISLPMEYLGREKFSSLSLLTVWDCHGIKEGDIISVTSLESFDRHISSQVHQGPFLNALKHLMTTKMSDIRVLQAGCVPKLHTVRSATASEKEPFKARILTTCDLLDKKKRGERVPNLFDVEAVVVLTSPVHLEGCLHRQWVFAIDYVEEGDGLSHPWVLAIKLSGPQDAIKWFEKHTGNYVSHVGNVSLKEFDAEQRFVQLQGSMGTELRAGATHCPHLTEILADNKDLLLSLKTRLMNLVG